MPDHEKRRHYLRLLALGGAGLGLAGYSWQRGIRFPSLSWEAAKLKTKVSTEKLDAELSDLIKIPSNNQILQFRAYAPEPSINLSMRESTTLQLSINNLANDAELIQNANNPVKEHIDGITRTLEVNLNRGQSLALKWKLPALKQGYKFASIGDTGGHHELAWSIQRAHALGARFFIHLGDFNYQPGDYDRAVTLFKESPIPCYVTIGNHDFHDNGNIYHQFLQQIGPLNNSFAIGPTRFANIDTAANFLPYSAGHRGKLFKALKDSREDYIDTVGFTHRPLYTPEDDDTHDIGSKAERDWLIDALNSAGVPTLLSGHIHIYNEARLKGIHNIIAGQGLGHQDLIVNRDYSNMVVGEVNDDGKVDYITKPLALPMNLHCHPRIDSVKQSLVDAPHYNVIKQINIDCAKLTKSKSP